MLSPGTHAVIAASYLAFALTLGLTLALQSALGAALSGLIAAGVGLVALQMHALFLLFQDKARTDKALKTLQTEHLVLQGALEEARDEMGAVARSIEEGTRARTDRVVSEVKVLETLIRQLSDGMTQTHKAMQAAMAGQAGQRPPEPVDQAGPWNEPAADHPAPEYGGAPHDIALEDIRDALENNRIDIYLQPIVSLPQRRVLYYEALSRLRDAQGRLILPDQYISVAQAAGLMSVIDNLLLFRSVQIIRRTALRDRSVALFCNVFGHTLREADFFEQFIEFMDYNTDLAGQLVFEFTQAAIERASPLEIVNLRRLSGLGFRFSMDRVTSLDLDPDFLRERNVKFVKVPAHLLLDRQAAHGMRGHPSDLKMKLERAGIDLIVERVEDERTVIEVLEFDVAFGQGFLFGEPRPLRDGPLDDRLPEAV